MKILGIEKITDAKAQERIIKVIETMASSNVYDTDEFSVIPNPLGIHPSFDIYPLAKQQPYPLSHISGIVSDMDGTTTTTEALCLHSLEFMVQKMAHKNIKLDPVKDFPHIIGNSTTKHVEYLIHSYQSSFDTTTILTSYWYAALWNVLLSQDIGRRQEAKETLTHVCHYLGIPLLELKQTLHTEKEIHTYVHTTLQHPSPKEFPVGLLIKMGVDIYYQRYHEILGEIARGNSKKIADELLHGRKPIEPMPGVAVFLALMKGYLSDDLPSVVKNTEKKESLVNLGRYFAKHPVKIALVTSSIFYEANIVLTEVFSVLSEEIKKWDIPEKKKKDILHEFTDYTSIYSAVVTATDSHEIRLKPHRDLYSIALYKLGLKTTEFPYVVGFEDSESGLLALRAAGVGNALGVPFEETKGHNLNAASIVLSHGLVEFVQDRQCLLNV